MSVLGGQGFFLRDCLELARDSAPDADAQGVFLISHCLCEMTQQLWLLWSMIADLEPKLGIAIIPSLTLELQSIEAQPVPRRDM